MEHQRFFMWRKHCLRWQRWILTTLTFAQVCIGYDYPGDYLSMSTGQETIPFPLTNGVSTLEDGNQLVRVDGSHDHQRQPPKLVILDTDMGNDIDDALALAMLHTLMQQGECRLLGVAVSKDNPFAAQYVDVVNTFYGNGNLPVGVVQNGVTPEDG